VGGGRRDRHVAHLGWLPRRCCPGDPDNWFPRRTPASDPDRRPDLPGESCGSHGDQPCIRRQAVPYRHSVPGLRGNSGGAVARSGDFTRALAFGIVLGPVEVGQTIGFALIVAVAYGIAVPLVIHVVAGELVLRGALVAGQRGPVGKLVPDSQGLGVLGA